MPGHTHTAGDAFWRYAFSSKICIFAFWLKFIFLKKIISRNSANQNTVVFVYQFDTIQHKKRHQMETFSALLPLCEGNQSVIGGFPSQRASNAALWCSCVVSLNKRLSKHSIDRWFETPWRSFDAAVILAVKLNIRGIWADVIHNAVNMTMSHTCLNLIGQWLV